MGIALKEVRLRFLTLQDAEDAYIFLSATD
jgi:hypothetical protein